MIVVLRNVFVNKTKQRLKGLAPRYVYIEIGSYWMDGPELCSTTPLLRGEKKHYDHKVDIYSFSIVLRELLTNLTPFKGMTSIQAAYAVASKSNKYMMMSMAGNGGMNGSNIGNVRNGGAASISAATTAIDHTRFPRRRERNSEEASMAKERVQ
ncbi:hypothetical protein IFM89_008972 [Coptis chinensis]|uniref:Protein kinase domain-containing protein n=1 Tax=Coptis chinensis TaxID=261450 RepID=A0A835HTS8_9MAGN|nr:hypothetical protein IFM89_008972 [Coptis chinensis]